MMTTTEQPHDLDVRRWVHHAHCPVLVVRSTAQELAS
jgi:hypothetical protein